MKMIMTLNGRVCVYSSVSWVLPNSYSGMSRVVPVLVPPWSTHAADR